MQKIEIINEIVNQTGIEKVVVQTVVKAFMENVKNSMIMGETFIFVDSGVSFSRKEQKKRGGILARMFRSKFQLTIFPHSSPVKNLPKRSRSKSR